jgi:hypothetical protein
VVLYVVFVCLAGGGKAKIEQKDGQNDDWLLLLFVPLDACLTSLALAPLTIPSSSPRPSRPSHPIPHTPSLHHPTTPLSQAAEKAKNQLKKKAELDRKKAEQDKLAAEQKKANEAKAKVRTYYCTIASRGVLNSVLGQLVRLA